ncbi:uncharacterized protein SPPG_06696 [Spizellomyces punctatus DAOM BR117]|uniref:Glycoside hydrolase family 5 domain-containing protein n=1 Tax=Spizellomyces punctatus (strain DAOM BR117) TaxID=645134 RepID=A0A0L0HAT8_SPIPD|nr:uncharacterized protein SPPG_06696 [Spizellomyces punctatus DAOM BR117]KNC98302.1 hypothetical protein SPPG_06696 [Spizellomyces punctatus DAOM BR117]|eukprot:XP_016606342.1 hypothetical protein SPPG_06696 [Spizellomyces punctatus DAOM BR117]
MDIPTNNLSAHASKNEPTDTPERNGGTLPRESAHEWTGCIRSNRGQFRDEYGRTLHLRGVNVSGNSKLPTNPPGSTHLKEGFFEHKHVSFVGRPFPLEEADEHFGRLRAWGLTFVRLLVPWEALEHEGPGIYDEEYIDYLIKVLERASRYGLKCFIDPHQDTWSRFSGGSGAPGWTFEVAGLDLTKFMETGAAYVHQSARPTDSGHTAWPTNYQKLASATMFTLFFGGAIFAPNATYQGEHMQEFLQRHFCACYRHLAQRLQHLSIVTGFEVINEPHFGYIGLKSLHQFDPLKDLHFGDAPSALQSMALGSGIPQEVDVWVKSWPWPTRKNHKRVINPGKTSVWLPGRECIWRQHGVWDIVDGQPRALVPDYFTKRRDGTPVDFGRDCYLPLIKRYTTEILSVNPDLLVYFEPIPNEDPPELSPEDDSPQLVYSPHWYDLKALFNKSFNGLITHDVQGLSRGTKNVLNATYFGVTGANKNYKGQIRNIVRTGRKLVGDKPVLFGECGIPMDMNEKKAFETGDYTHHTNFLDAMINAMEASLVNFTLWNYNPHNDNIWGDHWNGEDFSIYSPKPSRSGSRAGSRPSSRLALNSSEDLLDVNGDAVSVDGSEKADPPPTPSTPITPFDITDVYFSEGDHNHHHHVGGRALDAVIRPYAAKIAGEPITMRFNLKTLEFKLVFTTDGYNPATVLARQDKAELTKSGGAVDEVAGQWDSLAYVTEIFIPSYHYGDMNHLSVEVSDGEWKYVRERQTLYWCYDATYRSQSTSRSAGRFLWSMFFGQPTDAAADRKVTHIISIGPPKNELELSRSWITILWKWTIGWVTGWK